MSNQIRINDLEQELWKSADQLRANSHLNAQQYSVPVLGLIFPNHHFSPPLSGLFFDLLNHLLSLCQS